MIYHVVQLNRSKKSNGLIEQEKQMKFTTKIGNDYAATFTYNIKFTEKPNVIFSTDLSNLYVANWIPSIESISTDACIINSHNANGNNYNVYIQVKGY